jgi:Fe-S cluster biogenesis protein NfuA
MSTVSKERTMSDPAPDALNEPLQARVERVLALIRPGVQEDGGDFELVEISEAGVAEIRFLGACIGCPSSEMTLRDGIARNLRDRVPEVTDVIAVD